MHHETMLGIPTTEIGNPHKVDPSADSVLPVRRDIYNYSETAVLTTWSPTSEVGLFIHVGRCPQDVDLWYAQAIAYLPNGKAAVDRSWGRSSKPNEIATGNFMVQLGGGPGGWRSSFDGAGELCDVETMAARPTGSGAARPMRWELQCEAAGPLFDLYASGGEAKRQEWAQGSHTQQVMRVDGTLVVDGKRYSLNGTAANDHSSGPRSLKQFGSHHWLIGAFPGSTIHCATIFHPEGPVILDTGVEFRAGVDHVVTRLTKMSPLSRLCSYERRLTGTLLNANGIEEPIQLELLHQVPVTANFLNDNVNGIDWRTPEDLIMVEGKVRVTRANGEVGYAHLERSCMKSQVSQPPKDANW